MTPDTILDEEDRASLEADEHLARAFQGNPEPEIVAMRLKKAGYVRISDFRVLGPRSEGEPELPSNADAGD